MKCVLKQYNYRHTTFQAQCVIRLKTIYRNSRFAHFAMSGNVRVKFCTKQFTENFPSCQLKKECQLQATKTTKKKEKTLLFDMMKNNITFAVIQTKNRSVLKHHKFLLRENIITLRQHNNSFQFKILYFEMRCHHKLILDVSTRSKYLQYSTI